MDFGLLAREARDVKSVRFRDESNQREQIRRRSAKLVDGRRVGTSTPCERPDTNTKRGFELFGIFGRRWRLFFESLFLQRGQRVCERLHAQRRDLRFIIFAPRSTSQIVDLL